MKLFTTYDVTESNGLSPECACFNDLYIAGLPSKHTHELQRMDGREHDHQPRKRIRLEHTFESRITSFDPFHTGKPDGLDQGRYSGVCIQAPPRFKLEQEEATKAGSINPSISTYETHHRLTVDYHFAHYTQLDHPSTTTPEINISHPPSALSDTAGTPFDFHDGLSNRDPDDQVCFGMVGLLYFENGQYVTGRT